MPIFLWELKTKFIIFIGSRNLFNPNKKIQENKWRKKWETKKIINVFWQKKINVVDVTLIISKW